MQPDEPSEGGPSYVPGSQGRFITSLELSDWWHVCECAGQPPALEQGDRWFIDPPLMWEARRDSVLTRTLHILPPSLWRHRD